MSIEILVPTLGESVSEATVSNWLKNVGDKVSVDETICELETDKVSMEVPSPVSGTITNIFAESGIDVAVGALLCEIAEGDIDNASSLKKKEKVVGEKTLEKSKKEVAPVTTTMAVKTSPTAQIEAEKTGIDINVVIPTGGLGNVTKEDVQSVKPSIPKIETPSAGKMQNESLPTRATDPRGEEKIPMSKLRRVISTRLKSAQNTAALLTTFNEVDMTLLMELRSRYKDTFEKKHGTRLGFMGFFVKAAVQALRELPAVNAEIFGDEIIYKKYNDIGIAVGTPQGLVVPVLRNAEQMSVTQVESGIADFGRRAKDGKLTIDEMTGGTFTITNGGVFGSLLSTPIVNSPQSAILGLHKIEKRPVVIEDEIVIRKMMYLALTYDHRIIDGREAVTFLVRIKELIERPERLLLDI